MRTRRDFVKLGLAGGAGLAVGSALGNGRALATSAPLPADTAAGISAATQLTPYLDPMPTLVANAIDATDGGRFRLTTALISRKVHSQLPATRLFGYLPERTHKHDATAMREATASYLGPTIIARSGRPVAIRYVNGLAPDDFLKVFTNHGSSYLQFSSFKENRILTHLHGGFVAAIDDGNPFEQPDAIAPGMVQPVRYPNEQPATMLWYHDHDNGTTRLNVVAGLAGAYLIRDHFDTGHNRLLPGPLGAYELPLVLQDRQFNTNGSLLYPVAPAATHGPWIAEYFGDVMLVNGMIWPFLVVEPAIYRFRMLNGCNSRILTLRFSVRKGSPAVPMAIIGSDGGLLPVNPARTTMVVAAPAERFDIVCDFRRFAGQTLYLENTAPPPPVSTPAPPLTRVMRLNVLPRAARKAPRHFPGRGSLPRNPKIAALTSLGPPKLSGGSVTGRMITLNEVGTETPHWYLNLNAHSYEDPHPVIETLIWNSVEDWYFVNTTADTHPMHTHLFSFRVMGRYDFNADDFVAKFGGPNGVPQLDIATLRPFLTSRLIAPDPAETGFKDTVKANPGQITVVRARYTPPSTVLDSHGHPTEQKYVHHCHILEHEDNSMMERMLVRR